MIICALISVHGEFYPGVFEWATEFTPRPFENIECLLAGGGVLSEVLGKRMGHPPLPSWLGITPALNVATRKAFLVHEHTWFEAMDVPDTEESVQAFALDHDFLEIGALQAKPVLSQLVKKRLVAFGGLPCRCIGDAFVARVHSAVLCTKVDGEQCGIHTDFLSYRG